MNKFQKAVEYVRYGLINKMVDAGGIFLLRTILLTSLAIGLWVSLAVQPAIIATIALILNFNELRVIRQRRDAYKRFYIN